jgi:very-short-patch-repair endonuclease
MKKPSFATQNARRLRREMTPAEARLWDILRNGKVGRFKFRRQQPIGPYFADFGCFSARVIVELDGTSHLGREEHDRVRERYLTDSGFAVIRFENFVVMLDENRVVEAVVKVCTERVGPIPLTPNPSPAEGEGDK